MKSAIGFHFIAFAMSIYSSALKYQVKSLSIRAGSVITEDDPLSVIEKLSSVMLHLFIVLTTDLPVLRLVTPIFIPGVYTTFSLSHSRDSFPSSIEI